MAKLEGTTTFRVDFGRLQKYSEPETILSIFNLSSHISDEGSEEHPVVITDITVDEFAAFIDWFDNM